MKEKGTEVGNHAAGERGGDIRRECGLVPSLAPLSPFQLSAIVQSIGVRPLSSTIVPSSRQRLGTPAQPQPASPRHALPRHSPACYYRHAMHAMRVTYHTGV